MKLITILNEINNDELIKFHIKGINDRLGENFLTFAETNPNYVFSLVGDVKRINYIYGKKNKCERNSFNYVMDGIDEGKNIFPVGGYAFTESYYPIEHWWAYDSDNNTLIEVTPLEIDDISCYAGIIGYDIRQQLIDNETEWDKPFDKVNFFKGGHIINNYFKERN
jgi:hypothetical protein